MHGTGTTDGPTDRIRLPGSSRPRRGRLLLALAVVLALLGAGSLVLAVSSGPPAPARVDGPVGAVPPPPVPVADTSTGPVLGRSAPVTLDVPAIGVHTSLLTLGLNPDDTVEVPPLDSPEAGWYENSPTPGELGPSVILGHIDSARTGPGVFYDLRAVVPGDTISVTRADASVATFRVDEVARYPKTAFPTAEVYGDIDHAGLRLITCGGDFDSSARSYLDNIVVYASAVSGQVE